MKQVLDFIKKREQHISLNIEIKNKLREKDCKYCDMEILKQKDGIQYISCRNISRYNGY